VVPVEIASIFDGPRGCRAAAPIEALAASTGRRAAVAGRGVGILAAAERPVEIAGILDTAAAQRSRQGVRVSTGLRLHRGGAGKA
jgi:hypothetical protein